MTIRIVISRKGKARFWGTGKVEEELNLGLKAIYCAIKNYASVNPEVSEAQLKRAAANAIINGK